MSTSVLLFHPDFAKSKANRALADAAGAVEGVEVVDMYARYPDGKVDVEREVAGLMAVERLVLQFPVQWYSTPPLLKAWQDDVLSPMYYVHPKEQGDTMRGLPVLVAATAGNKVEAYTPEGVNLFPLVELLRPLQSTAHRCYWDWSEPFTVYEANKSSPEVLAAAGVAYAARLRELGGKPSRAPAA